MNLLLHMLVAMALQYGTVKVNGQDYVLTSSCGGVVTEGSSCVLTCETGNVTESPITWRRGTSPPYEVDRASCTTSNPAVPSDYVLACPGTSFTLTIRAAVGTRDETTWKCDAVFGGKESRIYLDVQAQVTTTRSQTTDNPTSTPEGSTVTVSTTPTPGICKNDLCYLFLLLLLPIIAIIVGVVCYCRKKKKRTSHTNTNAMKPIREQNESMSPEDQVNNDKSGQMRL